MSRSNLILTFTVIVFAYLSGSFGWAGDCCSLEPRSGIADVSQYRLQLAGYRTGMDGSNLNQDHFVYYKQTPNKEKLERYVTGHGGTLENAQKIEVVSECFGIDAYIFTNLIQWENKYQDTGGINGVGKTQMTSCGVTEVNDQFGYTGTAHSDCGSEGQVRSGGKLQAKREAVSWFRQKIKSCIEPRLLGGAPWIDVWNRPNPRHPKREPSINDLRWMMEDEDTALVYGAALLKTLLTTFAKTTGKTGLNLYSTALRQYNGNAPFQVAYARGILGLTKYLCGEKSASDGSCDDEASTSI